MTISISAAVSAPCRSVIQTRQYDNVTFVRLRGASKENPAGRVSFKNKIFPHIDRLDVTYYLLNFAHE